MLKISLITFIIIFEKQSLKLKMRKMKENIKKEKNNNLVNNL